MNPIRVGIAGCTGRTGATLLRLAAGDAGFRVVAALTAAGDPQIGQDAGAAAGGRSLGVPVSTAVNEPCDVLIEFTAPAGCAHWAHWCAQAAVPLVSGTTGLTAAERSILQQAARQVPILWAANMSIGVNLLLQLTAEVAARLDENWDVEITETHHRHKADAPSGTAKALLAEIARARGGDPDQMATYGRSGQPGPRPVGQVGIHAVRMGEIVGEHKVAFASAHETLTLGHRAFSREAFAAGALAAARWIIGKPAGLYAMRDVLAGNPRG